MFKRFITKTDGNVSTMMAVMLMGLVITVGGVIDISMLRSNQMELQAVNDSAALAAARQHKRKQMEKAATDILSEHFENDMSRVVIDKIKTKRRTMGDSDMVTVVTTARKRSYFLGIIGKHSFPISVSSEVVTGNPPLEVSLVLDISNSMAGNKIVKMKSSTQSFIEIIFKGDDISDKISMSIVPFGGNVNIGADLTEHFVPTLTSSNLNPSSKEYKASLSSTRDHATEGYRFSDGMNCIETTLTDLNEGAKIPERSRSQLPRFIHKNDLLPICPDDNNSVIFHSSNKADLIQKVTDLSLSHGTGMDVGMFWGQKALSPDYRGLITSDIESRPSDYTPNVQKIMVVMTDGNITRQGRPNFVDDPNRLTDPDRMKNSELYHDGYANSVSGSDTAAGRFKKSCDIAKENGVIVYTIGFKIKKGQIADTLLQECATSPSHYYFVKNLKLEEVFGDIARSIETLRISM